uniref:Putative secreted protein n=1 Tax=Desmodus rotundus TaxID=9430 RepID=K9IWE7_DESRO
MQGPLHNTVLCAQSLSFIFVALLPWAGQSASCHLYQYSLSSALCIGIGYSSASSVFISPPLDLAYKYFTSESFSTYHFTLCHLIPNKTLYTSLFYTCYSLVCKDFICCVGSMLPFSFVFHKVICCCVPNKVQCV